jgi:HK97 family phage prohead protease
MKLKSLKSEVVDVVEDKGIVTIAISKFDNRDSYDDIVRKGAFTKTFKESGNRIKHVLDHNLRTTAIVGLPIKMYETDTHAIVESKLNLEKQIARDLFSDYKFFQENGRTLEHSFMYDTIKKNENKTIKGEDIAELKMYEYSTVALGANPETPLLGIKSIDELPLLEEYLKKYDVSNKRGKEIEDIIAKIKALSEPLSTQDTDEPVNTLVKGPDPNIESINQTLQKIKKRSWTH